MSAAARSAAAATSSSPLQPDLALPARRRRQGRIGRARRRVGEVDSFLLEKGGELGGGEVRCTKQQVRR
jgi:hypothetical protein